MSNFEYKPSPAGAMMRSGFARRPRQEILTGDVKAAGDARQDPGNGLRALSDGNYEGLESMDFAVYKGNPVAVLPDGHMVVITPGQLLAGVNERENQRRKIVERMALEADRDFFADQNRDAFDSMLEQFEFTEQIAGGYRALYGVDPAGVMSDLLNYDATSRQDRERAARKVRQTQIQQRDAVSEAGVKNLSQGFLARGGSSADVASAQIAGGALSRVLASVAGSENPGEIIGASPSSINDLGLALDTYDRGVVTTARRAFSNFDGSMEEFMQTPEFTRLNQSAAGMESQIRLGIDTLALSRSLIEVDQFDPRSGPMFTSLAKAEADRRVGQYERPRDLEAYRTAAREFAKGDGPPVSGDLRQQNFQSKLENLAYQYAQTNPPQFIEGENRTLTVIRHFYNNAVRPGSSANMALGLLGDSNPQEYLAMAQDFINAVEGKLQPGME